MNFRKIGYGLGYTLWFSVVFSLLTWLTFPWSKVRDQAMVGAHDAGISLQMQSLSAGPFGAKIKGLSVGPRGDGDEAPPAWIKASRVKLKSGPIALLKGGLEGRRIASEGRIKTAELLQRMIAALGSTKLEVDMYGGELRLEVDGDRKAARFEVKVDGLDLGQYPIRAGIIEADPTGALNSDIDVIWNWDDPRKTSGNVDIELGNLVLAGFKAGGVAIPEASFDRSEIHLRIKSGKAEFRDTSFESEVVTAEVGGFITLKKRFMRSTLSLNLKFKVRPNLDGLVKLAMGKNPRHRDDEGWYYYQVLGNLARPKLRPSPIGGQKKAPPRRQLPTRDLGDDDDSEPRSDTRVKDRRNTRRSDAIERPEVGDDRRQELEERRTKLREERRARRERQREARRKRALDRAAELDPRTLEDLEPLQPADELERVNGPDDLEIEGDFNEGDGDIEGDGGDFEGGDYPE
jgi:type II secretion system protein N